MLTLRPLGSAVCCALRCRRTEARNAAAGSMVPGPIRRGMLGAGRHASGGHSAIINLGAGQLSDVSRVNIPVASAKSEA